jgi:hypothetical protein
MARAAHGAILRVVGTKNRWSGRLNFFVTRVIELGGRTRQIPERDFTPFQPDFDHQKGTDADLHETWQVLTCQ